MLTAVSVGVVLVTAGLAFAIVRLSGKLSDREDQIADRQDQIADLRSSNEELTAERDRQHERAEELAHQLQVASRDAAHWRKRYHDYAASMKDRIDRARDEFIRSADRDRVIRRLSELGNSARHRKNR